jgi:hypothetical protein
MRSLQRQVTSITPQPVEHLAREPQPGPPGPSETELHGATGREGNRNFQGQCSIPLPVAPGFFGDGGGLTKYVDRTHWSAILAGVC